MSTLLAMNTQTRFELLYESHVGSIYRYFTRRSAISDCEDLTAEVFTIAWRKIAEIPTEMELAWLYKTAWNVLANKRRKFVEIPIEELDIEGDDIADVIIEDENLKNAWLRLSIRDREVLRLTAWDGLTPDQLALVLNISVSGAGAALSRARRKFEEEMVK